jgi:CDP-diacylglycerol--glycerol-3-phosphate 3-phosphatidyltransferase
MNFTSSYTDILLHKCLSNISIITASPQANGFFTAKDYSNFIPFAYAALELQFYKLIDKYKQHFRLHLFEYYRANWTFHGKGLWYTLPGDESPSVSLVGSANLGTLLLVNQVSHRFRRC